MTMTATLGPTGWDSRMTSGNALSLSSEQVAALGAGLRFPSVLTYSLIGDSISDNDQATTSAGINGPRSDGAGFLSQALTGGRVVFRTARATGGMTISQIAATHVPQVILDKPTMCRVLAGTNDTYGATTPDAASVIFQRLKTLIWEPLRAAGILLQVCTLPLSASRTSTITAAQHGAARGLNSLIRAAAAADATLMLVDLEPVGASASGSNEGLEVANYVATEPTYIHPNDSGAMTHAVVGVEALQSAGLAAATGEIMGLQSPYSLGTNPAIAGSNATAVNGTTLGTGASGTGPNDWTIQTNNVASTVVATPGAVPRSDGLPGQLLQLAVTIGADGQYAQTLPMSGAALFVAGASTAAVRQNSTQYRAGQVRRFGASGGWYKTVQPGITAAAQPGSLPDEVGGLVIDGGAVWMRLPSLLPGAFIRAVARVMFTAHAGGNILPQAYLRQYTVAFGNLAAGVEFEHDGQMQVAGNAAGAWGVVSGPGLTGFNGYRIGALPLNRWLWLITPWTKIAADAGILEPQLRIYGTAGATATAQISYADLQLRP